MNDDAYEELVDLAKFCLLTRMTYKDALELTDTERAAFIEAYNEIHKD